MACVIWEVRLNNLRAFAGFKKIHGSIKCNCVTENSSPRITSFDKIRFPYCNAPLADTIPRDQTIVI